MRISALLLLLLLAPAFCWFVLYLAEEGVTAALEAAAVLLSLLRIFFTRPLGVLAEGVAAAVVVEVYRVSSFF